MSRTSLPRLSIDAVLARSPHPVLEWVRVKVWAAWAYRQERTQLLLLAQMDDSQLDDIGVAREQIEVTLNGMARMQATTDGLLFAAVVAAGLIALLWSF